MLQVWRRRTQVQAVSIVKEGKKGGAPEGGKSTPKREEAGAPCKGKSAGKRKEAEESGRK